MVFRLLLVVSSLVVFSAAQAQEPLGMVVDVQGAVSAAEGAKTSRVEMLSYLRPGMELDLASGASLTVTWYANSKEMKFSGPAKLKVAKDGIQGGKANERSLGEEKVAAGKNGMPGRLAQATIMMRSLGKPPAPQDTSAPLTDAERARLEKLKPAPSAGFSDWLLYAVALEEAKQTADARPIWKKLAAERPDEPKLRQYADR